jgi:hypothetical protein
MICTSRFLILCCLLILCLDRAIAAQPPELPNEFYKGSYHLQVDEERRVKATLSTKVEYDGMNTLLWVGIVPVPPDLTFQKLEKMNFSADIPSVIDRVYDTKQGRPIERLMAPVPDEIHKDQVDCTAEFNLILRKTHLVPGKAKENTVPTLTDDETKRYVLEETPYVQWRNPTFQGWLKNNKLKRKEGESPLNYVYRFLTFMRENMAFTPDNSWDKTSTKVCISGKSDCGGLTFVLVAALRDAYIPARILCGRNAISADDTTPQFHVIAEFYEKEIGWISTSPDTVIVNKGIKIESLIGNPDRFIAISIGDTFGIPNPVNNAWVIPTAQTIGITFGTYQTPYPPLKKLTVQWVVNSLPANTKSLPGIIRASK